MAWHRRVFWFEAADRKSHLARKIEKFPWTRSQGWEVEGKSRRVVTTPPWRNKSYHKRILNMTIFQVKKDLPESSAKHPTLRTIPKDEGRGRTSHHVHERRYWKGSPPSWRCDRHYFAYCWLYDQKAVGGQWTFGRHLVLSCFLANETWTRSISSSEFTLGKVRRNESSTCRHHYVTYGGRVIPTIDNQGNKFPCGRLFILL